MLLISGLSVEEIFRKNFKFQRKGIKEDLEIDEEDET